MNEEEKKHFVEILERLKELRLKKSMDYGTSWKIYGLDGIAWQIKSKFIRMINLMKVDGKAENEPLRDTFMDMANYCIMAMQLIEMNATKDSIDKLLEIKEQE